MSEVLHLDSLMIVHTYLSKGAKMVDVNFKINFTYGRSEGMNDVASADFVHFIFWGIIIPIIVVFGLIGNILTIIVLWRKEMHSTTVYYLRVLVVTDTVIIVLSFLSLTPLSIANYTNTMAHLRYVIYPFIFTPFNYLVMTVQAINVWVTVSVTVERYIAICHPFIAIRILTRSKALIVIVSTIFLCILYNLPRLFATTTEKCPIDSNRTNCYTISETQFGKTPGYKEIYFGWMYSIVIFILPLSVLFVMNTLLILELMNMRRRRIGTNITGDNEANMSLALVLIVVVFIVCQTPGLVAQFDFLSAVDLLKWIAVSNTMFVFNSSVNFLVYTVVGRKFRQVLFRTFRPLLAKTFGACRLEFPDDRPAQYELTTMNDNTLPTQNSDIPKHCHQNK